MHARGVCVCLGGHVYMARGGMHGQGSCVAGGGVRGRRDGHCSGRYASYWNAFLFLIQNQVVIIMCSFSLNRRLEWKNFEVVITGRKTIEVKNVANEAKEKLDFRDRIIKASLAFKHLVVATSSQCYVYT